MTTAKHELKTIKIDDVKSEHKIRVDFGDMKRLTESLRREGQLDLLSVYKDGEGYQVIDGHRRLKAASDLGWETVQCMVFPELKPAEAAHIAYTKNMERKNYNPIEEALHLKAMKEEYGFSCRQLQVKGYGTPARISQKMKLLDLPEKIQNKIAKGDLTPAHGKALLRLPTAKEQVNMAKQISDYGWNATKTKKEVSSYISKGKNQGTSEDEDTKPIPDGDVRGVHFKDSKNMDELPNDSVHLIPTSPPYFAGMEFEKGITWHEHWENVEAVMTECARVLVPGGVIAINVGDIRDHKGPEGTSDNAQIYSVAHRYQTFLRKHNVYMTDQIAWVKSNSPFSKDIKKTWNDKMAHTEYRIVENHDPVYIFRKKGEREAPSGEIVLKSRISKEEWKKYAQSVWHIDQCQKQEEHPAMFPDELPRRLIKMFSYEGDTVVDPFLGSGTTVKVARELNRDAYGYERDTRYKEIIMKKLGVVNTEQPETAKPEQAAPEIARPEQPASEIAESEQVATETAQLGQEAPETVQPEQKEPEADQPENELAEAEQYEKEQGEGNTADSKRETFKEYLERIMKTNVTQKTSATKATPSFFGRMGGKDFDDSVEEQGSKAKIRQITVGGAGNSETDDDESDAEDI